MSATRHEALCCLHCVGGSDRLAWRGRGLSRVAGSNRAGGGADPLHPHPDVVAAAMASRDSVGMVVLVRRGQDSASR